MIPVDRRSFEIPAKLDAQVWILVLRPLNKTMCVVNAISLRGISRRITNDQSIRYFTFKIKGETTRELVMRAVEHLSQNELWKMYDLPQQPLFEVKS